MQWYGICSKISQRGRAREACYLRLVFHCTPNPSSVSGGRAMHSNKVSIFQRRGKRVKFCLTVCLLFRLGGSAYLGQQVEGLSIDGDSRTSTTFDGILTFFSFSSPLLHVSTMPLKYESLFNMPGLGTKNVNAASVRDGPFIWRFAYFSTGTCERKQFKKISEHSLTKVDSTVIFKLYTHIFIF